MFLKVIEYNEDLCIFFFRCGKCNFQTSLKASLMKHCRNEHGDNKIKCQDCDYVTGKRI